MNLLIGLLAGIFGGLLGAGGGIVMIPLMVGILKMTQREAHGTSLVAIVFTGIAGAIVYSMKGSVDFVAAVLIAITAIFAAPVGAHFAHSLPEWKLKRSFGAFVLLVSILLLLKPYMIEITPPVSGWAKIIVLLLAGVATGFLSGMMGVGGSAIMIPAMVLLIGMSQHMAQGSSLLVMVPTGAAGAYAHYKLGNVSTKLLPGLILGIFIGAYLGGTLALILSDPSLRFIFTIILIGTSIRYLTTPIPKRAPGMPHLP
jgi:uncharacterized membrane protein YfcA